MACVLGIVLLVWGRYFLFVPGTRGLVKAPGSLEESMHTLPLGQVADYLHHTTSIPIKNPQAP